ncbi:MAG: TetR/AcrR family transcriptional regulator [Ktedonobacteraceae bacterium]|nr:TetR/AcrR family transcriptional regulator [Ktedonobacteraceae bacterium]MBO0792572.1 TetR/AcrR family transcriptional regulator [Ktedonobacteraceae bacterium]
MSETTPHRSLKERQRQEREDLILHAAEEVLLEKGYYEASMDEIAARVGIAKGTLYLHFAKKEDLVLALLERGLRSFMQNIEVILASDRSAQEKLEAIFYSRGQSLFGDNSRLLSIIYNSIDLRPMFLQKKEVLQQHMNHAAALVNNLFEQGKAEGVFDRSLPTAIMRSLFFSMLSPHVHKLLTTDEELTPEELIRHLGRIYFRAIAADPVQKTP